MRFNSKGAPLKFYKMADKSVIEELREILDRDNQGNLILPKMSILEDILKKHGAKSAFEPKSDLQSDPENTESPAS